MQFPDTPVVFRQTADPAEECSAVEHGASEAAVYDICHFFAGSAKVRPPARLVEMIDQECGALLPNVLRLSGKVDDIHPTDYNANVVQPDRSGSVLDSDVRSQLERILATDEMARSPNLTRFLHFVVEEALAGRGSDLKEYVIAVRVFERNEGFDPRLDPIVRVQARKLRSRLQQYYERRGAADRIIIELPKGGYSPVFHLRERVPPPASSKPSRWAVLGAVGVLGLSALVVLLTLSWRVARSSTEPAAVYLGGETFDTGWTGHPAISRDGRLLAFASDREGGHLDIWVRPRTGGELKRLTHDRWADRSLDFSPDGTKIVYRSFRPGGGIFDVPVNGGPYRKLAEGGFRPRYSPDGRWIAFSQIGSFGSSEVVVIPSEGGTTRKLSSNTQDESYALWTRDGRHILFKGRGRGVKTFDLWAVPFDPSGGETGIAFSTGAAATLQQANVRHGPQDICPSDWLDDALIYMAETSVWRLEISPHALKVDGPPRPIVAAGPLEDHVRVFSRPGKDALLYYTPIRRAVHLFALPVDTERAKATGELQQLTNDVSILGGFDGARGHVSFDGMTLLYVSSQSGTKEFWRKNFATGTEERIPLSSRPPRQFVASSDLKYIVFSQTTANRPAVYIAALDSSAPTRLCEDCGLPKACSSDCRAVLTLKDRKLQSIDVQTHAISVLLDDARLEPEEVSISPDSRWIALVTAETGKNDRQGYVIPNIAPLPAKSTWIPIVREPYDLELHWSPDGTVLYYLNQRDGFRCLWAQKLDSTTKRPFGEPIAVWHFHQHQRYPLNGSRLAIARDKIVLTLTESLANIWSAILKP